MCARCGKKVETRHKATEHKFALSPTCGLGTSFLIFVPSLFLTIVWGASGVLGAGRTPPKHSFPCVLGLLRTPNKEEDHYTRKLEAFYTLLIPFLTHVQARVVFDGCSLVCLYVISTSYPFLKQSATKSKRQETSKHQFRFTYLLFYLGHRRLNFPFPPTLFCTFFLSRLLLNSLCPSIVPEIIWF